MVQQDDILCYRCGDSCYGDVVHLGGQYYHQYCFTCKRCNIDLVETGYFEVDGEFYCNSDYHIIKGTKCDGCGKFIEGEAVTAVNSHFHQECFGCHSCGKLFPPGANVIYDGEDFLCETCNNPTTPKDTSTSLPPQNQPKKQESPSEAPMAIRESGPPPYQSAHVSQSPQMKATEVRGDEDANCCAGCGNDIKSGQALLALEKQWHLWCFTCHKCGCLLAGEYMGRDGVPYCEQDYQAEFGVTCAGCGGYITGKVLQAGEKHYHPHCSRCAKCGDIFGEGEEMYLQGSEIWHPHCSEEYQRENEELEKAAVESGRIDNGISSQTYNLGVTETQAPQRSPNITVRKTSQGSLQNGSNHRTSYSSTDGSIDRNLSQPPGYDDFLKNREMNGMSKFTSDSSMDLKNNNTWQPPVKDESKMLPHYDDIVKKKEENRPVGFRSVKPPQPVEEPSIHQQSIQFDKKPVSPDASDDETPPPIPPPPTRSSSSAWKQRYSGQPNTVAYTAKPFQKQAEVALPSNRKNRSSMSFVDSAAARKLSTDKPSHGTSRNTVSVSSARTTSTSSSNDGRDDRDSAMNENTAPRKTHQKGVGFNKLQLRKAMGNQSNGYAQRKSLDSEDLKKLNSNPNGNTYPYEVLKTNSYKTPLHVDRNVLETYLTDEEFHDVFQMNRNKFYSLPKWKQEDLKKKTTLF